MAEEQLEVGNSIKEPPQVTRSTINYHKLWPPLKSYKYLTGATEAPPRVVDSIEELLKLTNLIKQPWPVARSTDDALLSCSSDSTCYL